MMVYGESDQLYEEEGAATELDPGMDSMTRFKIRGTSPNRYAGRDPADRPENGSGKALSSGFSAQDCREALTQD